jgi:hypothetical protein
MTSKFEAVERLIAVCPDFQPRWQERLEFDEGKRFGEYVDMGLLADWVIDQMIEDDLDCMPALFAEVELLLEGASDDVRNVVVIGLLEDIHHWLAGSYGDKGSALDPELIVPFFGSNTKKEWSWLISSFGDVGGSGGGPVSPCTTAI